MGYHLQNKSASLQNGRSESLGQLHPNLNPNKSNRNLLNAFSAFTAQCAFHNRQTETHKTVPTT